MAVDLSNLVPLLSSRVSPPGTNLYPQAVKKDWTLALRNAFLDAKIKGMLTDWTENKAARQGPEAWTEGIITPISAVEGYDDPDGAFMEDVDLPEELQQLVVFLAAWRITLAKMQEVKTVFKAKAGPTEFERQQSAQLLKAVLDSLKEEIKEIQKYLSTFGRPSTVIFDAFVERTYSQYTGEGLWVR